MAVEFSVCPVKTRQRRRWICVFCDCSINKDKDGKLRRRVAEALGQITAHDICEIWLFVEAVFPTLVHKSATFLAEGCLEIKKFVFR